MNDPCLSFEVLSRSHSENEEPAHLGHCERCRRTFAALARLDDLARSIPHEAPDPLHTLHMEQALVALAAPPRRRSLAALFPAPRARWAIGAAVAVSAAIALVAVLPAPRAPLRQLEASPGARYDHARRAMDGGTIDWMSLSQGTISLHVEHLGQGERFVVATTDAEVEVRGTRFEVDAREGKLRRVQVQEGMVEVRAAGRAPVALRPGERWLPDDGSSEASATIAAGREGVGASPGDGLPAPVDAPDAPGIPFPLPGTERENAAPGALSRLPGGAL
ncbi:MAG TPA: FecR family protein, partial [Vulgatibacter sp.]